MALEPGKTLGPYKVVAAIGAGGMGEVYRASDSRLRRDVAIKVLPAQFADSPDRLRRFEQEARSAAALDHPGILAVFDIGVFEGTPYLVTELLQGDTLRNLLGGGRLPLAKVRELARQLLEALAAAHDRGIVHRDLKPENLFQTRDGRLKILDFGLAKVLEPPASELPVATTLVDYTEKGALVGTVGYMAPEQARGESVDPRADLFAVGAIVHEMLTGERAFAAASAIETLHAILHAEPPAPSTVVTTVPPALDAVLRRSLAKSRTDRFQSARDFAFALDLAFKAAAPASSVAPAGPSTWRRATLWTVAGVATGALLAVLATSRMRGRDAAASSAAGVEVGALAPLTVDPGYEGQPSFSPDGETVAYVSDRSGDFEIYLQQVAGGPAINLSRDPGDDVQPSISPDGRQIAFVSTRSSRLALIYRSPDMPLMGGDVWAMPLLGGLPRKVSEEGNFPSWSPDGKTIYFARGTSFRSEIRRAPASGTGSEVVPIVLPDEFTARMMHHPRVSPSGEWLLFLAGERVFYVPIAGGTATSLAMGSDAIWDPDGRSVLFCNADPGRNWGLWRIPFVPGGAGSGGVATPVLPGPSAIEGVAIAASGDRLVVARLDRTANLEELQLDAEAGVAGETELPLTRGHDPIAFASPAPDSRSVVYESRRGASDHLWRLDFGQEPVQLTSDPAWGDSFPRWSPDGRWIAFARRPAGMARRPQLAQLWLMSPDGGGPRRLVEEAGHMAWLPDSRRLVFIHGDRLAIADVASGGVVPLTITGASRLPIFAVSPDGQWIVYQSPDRGDVDLVRVPITGGEARVVLQTEKQDFHPNFSPSGRWLYFQSDHRNLWRIPGPAQNWREAAPEKITHFPESGLYIEDPLLSTDGKRLIYSRIRISADLWIIELDKSGRH